MRDVITALCLRVPRAAIAAALLVACCALGGCAGGGAASGSFAMAPALGGGGATLTFESIYLPPRQGFDRLFDVRDRQS